MKKFLVLSIMALVAGLANADGYMSLEYSDETNRQTHIPNIKQGIIVGIKDGVDDYSLHMETAQKEFGNGSISEAMEARYKRNFDMFYLGGRLGEKVTSSKHFSYYAFDTGVKIPLGSGFTGDLGYRYRNAFDTANTYQSDRIHLGVGYALTKKDLVAVRWMRSWGDDEKDTWRLIYTRSF
jgi:opacity protein-like surface antigen